MSDQKIECPCCGEEMFLSGTVHERWICRNSNCELGGPIDDPDGSKVKRLEFMPDPKVEHEGLTFFQVGHLLATNPRSEYSETLGETWWKLEDGPPSINSLKLFSWRPPQPQIKTREGLTLQEVFEAAPDGKTIWATHPESDTRKWHTSHGDTTRSMLIHRADEPPLPVRPIYLTNWTLHERVPAKGES